MGISTLQSYRGAQVFEAIGLNKALIDKYFTGTASRIEGVGLDVLAREAQMKHEHAFQPLTESPTLELAVGGNYQYRVRGEYHLFNPLTVSASCSTRSGTESYSTFQEYTRPDRRAEHDSCARCAGCCSSRSRRARSARRSRAGAAKSSSASPPAR